MDGKRLSSLHTYPMDIPYLSDIPYPPEPQRWTVRILLECFLVNSYFLTQENSNNAVQFQGPNSNELNIGRSRQTANVPVVKSINDEYPDLNGGTVNFLISNVD